MSEIERTIQVIQDLLKLTRIMTIGFNAQNIAVMSIEVENEQLKKQIDIFKDWLQLQMIDRDRLTVGSVVLKFEEVFEQKIDKGSVEFSSAKSNE